MNKQKNPTRCRRCGILKKVNDFYSTVNFITMVCGDCRVEVYQETRRRNLSFVPEKDRGHLHMNMRHCGKCDRILHFDHYLVQRNRSQWRLGSQCAECIRDYSKSIRTKEEIYLANRSETTMLSKKRQHLRKRYGLTLEDYDKILKQQDNKCEICSQEFGTESRNKVNIDHCHKTNQVRGFLCNTCNVGLGSAKDDIRILEKMKRYLIKYNYIAQERGLI